MQNVWALASLWVGLALLATLLVFLSLFGAKMVSKIVGPIAGCERSYRRR